MTFALHYETGKFLAIAAHGDLVKHFDSMPVQLRPHGFCEIEVTLSDDLLQQEECQTYLLASPVFDSIGSHKFSPMSRSPSSVIARKAAIS